MIDLQNRFTSLYPNSNANRHNLNNHVKSDMSTAFERFQLTATLKRLQTIESNLIRKHPNLAKLHVPRQVTTV